MEDCEFTHEIKHSDCFSIIVFRREFMSANNKYHQRTM